MIVVDSSAIVSVMFGEPGAPSILHAFATASEPVMSVANYVGTGTVLAGRRTRAKRRAIADLDTMLREMGVTLAPVDEEQARIALVARVRFGRGMGHGGVLNFGDTFAYALAKSRNAPLLCTGDDFRVTDIELVLA